MIYIYTGSGKGKTTAALGMALRAAGQNLKVIIFQFLKPKSFLSGEEITLRKIQGVRLVKFDQCHPMFASTDISPTIIYRKLKKQVEMDFRRARTIILGKKYDMVVLDEIINVLDQGLLDRTGFISLLKRLPSKVELILTGRGDISAIEEYADYVTIMKDKRHPFKKGLQPRRGIEY